MSPASPGVAVVPLLSKVARPRLHKAALLPPPRRRREVKARQPKEQQPPQSKVVRPRLHKEPLLRPSRADRLRRLKERILPQLLQSRAGKHKPPKLVLLLLLRRELKGKLHREQLLLLTRVLRLRRSRAPERPLLPRLKEQQQLATDIN